MYLKYANNSEFSELKIKLHSTVGYMFNKT